MRWRRWSVWLSIVFHWSWNAISSRHRTVNLINETTIWISARSRAEASIRFAWLYQGASHVIWRNASSSTDLNRDRACDTRFCSFDFCGRVKNVGQRSRSHVDLKMWISNEIHHFMAYDFVLALCARNTCAISRRRRQRREIWFLSNAMANASSTTPEPTVQQQCQTDTIMTVYSFIEIINFTSGARCFLPLYFLYGVALDSSRLDSTRWCVIVNELTSIK